MTVGEVIAALTPWPEGTPVKLRAYCCTDFHDLKVDYAYEGMDAEGRPCLPVVLILDHQIRMWDRLEDIEKGEPGA